MLFAGNFLLFEQTFDERSTYKIQPGDIGMYTKSNKRRRIAVVLEIKPDSLLTVLIVKSKKKKMILQNHLVFPDGYFTDREWHIKDCGKHLS